MPYCIQQFSTSFFLMTSNNTPADQLDISRVLAEMLEFRNEVRGNFVRVTSRLDQMNGKVQTHTIDIELIKQSNSERDKIEVQKLAEAQQQKLLDGLKQLVKDYGTPVSIAGMIVYWIGHSAGVW